MYYTAKRGEWQEDSEKRERLIDINIIQVIPAGNTGIPENLMVLQSVSPLRKKYPLYCKGEKWINRTLGEKNTPFQANKIKKIASWWIQRSSARHCIIEYGFEERRRSARFKVMQPAFLFSLHCRDGAIPPPFREPSWSRRIPPWRQEWFPADRCGTLRRRRLPAFRASRRPDGRNRYPRRS